MQRLDGEKIGVNSLFNAYNVWRALQDSSIQHARVLHKYGHTERMD